MFFIALVEGWKRYGFAFDGRGTPTIDALHKLLTEKKVGEASEIKVVRGKEKISFSMRAPGISEPRSLRILL